MSGFWSGFVVGGLVFLGAETAIEYVLLRRVLKRTGLDPNIRSFLRRFGV